MILNAEIALFCVFSPNSIALQADYVRKILSPSSSLPLLAKTNAPCSAVSAIAEHLVTFGGSYVCANFGENQSRIATVRVRTYGYTHTHTHTHTHWQTQTDFYRAACNADAVLWWEFCPSVCPSITRVYCDKTVERSVQIYIPYERTFSLVFWEKEWLVGDDPFYLKFWVNGPPFEQNRRFSTNNRS